MKNLLRFLLVLPLTYFCLVSFGQLTLLQSPKEKAFIPQDKDSRSAKILLKGTIDDPGFTSLSIKILRNGVQIANHVQSLNFNQQIADFSQAIELKPVSTYTQLNMLFLEIRHTLTQQVTF